MRTVTSTIAIGLAAVLTVGIADSAPPPIKSIVDAKLYERAEVVLRARIIAENGGSKYWWAEVISLAVLKAPRGFTPPSQLRVAHESVGAGLPLGTATIYLVRYNIEHPEYGWKLLEAIDSTRPFKPSIPDKRYMKGYSHYSKP